MAPVMPVVVWNVYQLVDLLLVVVAAFFEAAALGTSPSPTADASPTRHGVWKSSKCGKRKAMS
jgi:hypothetical protein